LREWYEVKFAFAFRSKFGTEFQEFFASIMEHVYPEDFQRVKPYGNVGDKKCDGYRHTSKCVFQVYAPEKMNVAETNGKIEEDFTGAVTHWAAKMCRWTFVHNQWRGMPADVVQKLIDLDGKHGVTVSRWCEVELRDEFFRLSPADQALILGPALTPLSVSRVGMRDVVEVVGVISQQEASPASEIGQVPAGKLKANALSENVQHLLTMGSRKSKLVKKFFDEWNDPELGDRVAQAFKSKYQELRSTGVVGDEIFHELWQFAGGGAQETMNRTAAVLAVLAFLFEECEIFEPSTSGGNN